MENEIEEFYKEYIGLELDIEEYRKTDRLSKVLVVFASVMLSIGITYLLSYYNIIADGIEDIGIAGFRGPLVASVSSLLVFAAIFLMAIALRLRLRNVRSDIDKYVVVRYELCKSIRDYKNNDFEEVVRHLKTYQKKLTVGPHYLPSFLLVISFEKFANLIYIRRLKQSEDLKKSLHGTFEGFLMANIQLIENKIADDIFDAAYQIEIKEQESSSYLAIFCQLYLISGV